MNEELVLLITNEFRQFFPGDYDEIPECTFDCGDGWYRVLHELCAKLSLLTLKPEFRITSVAVRFGKMRIGTNRCSPAIDTFILDAENASEKICEICAGEAIMHCRDDRLMVRCRDCWSRNFYEETEVQETES